MMWKYTINTSLSIEFYSYKALYLEKNSSKKSLIFYRIYFRQSSCSFYSEMFNLSAIISLHSLNLSCNYDSSGVIYQFFMNYSSSSSFSPNMPVNIFYIVQCQKFLEIGRLSFFIYSNTSLKLDLSVKLVNFLVQKARVQTAKLTNFAEYSQSSSIAIRDKDT